MKGLISFKLQRLLTAFNMHLSPKTIGNFRRSQRFQYSRQMKQTLDPMHTSVVAVEAPRDLLQAVLVLVCGLDIGLKIMSSIISSLDFIILYFTRSVVYIHLYFHQAVEKNNKQ